MDIRRKNDERMSGGQPQQSMPSSGGSSNLAGTVLIVIGLAVLIGLGFYFSDGGGGLSGPVAIVNGQEIDGDELSEQIESLRNSTSTQAQQFKQLSDTRQQEILLEGIINTELQLQAAKQAGITISDEEVESQLQQRISQIGEEEFETRLQENDVTRAEVKENLRDQMLISALIQQEAGGQITASDQEIQDLYSQYTTQIQQSGSAAPELAQLRPQIEAAVIQQKQQQIASEILSAARANADIEILLDGVEYPASTSTAPAAPAGDTAPAATATPSATQ